MYKNIFIPTKIFLFQNILTDLIVEPEKIPCSRSHMYDEWFAHKGMLKTAMSVKNVLESKDILTQAYNKCPVSISVEILK